MIVLRTKNTVDDKGALFDQGPRQIADTIVVRQEKYPRSGLNEVDRKPVDFAVDYRHSKIFTSTTDQCGAVSVVLKF